MDIIQTGTGIVMMLFFVEIPILRFFFRIGTILE